MEITRYPVDQDDCFNVRMNGDDIGQVYRYEESFGDQPPWNIFHMGTEVYEGPFRDYRTAERRLCQLENPDYGLIDNATSELLKLCYMTFIEESQLRGTSAEQKAYRFGMSSMYAAFSRILEQNQTSDFTPMAEFHAQEVDTIEAE